MKNYFLLLMLCVLSLQAQHQVSGNFSPAEDYTWLLVYRITPSGQEYITDSAIKNGAFNIKIGENEPIGTYRIVYAVPQEEYYIDILYSGEEDVTFEYSFEGGLKIISSIENTQYNDYFIKTNALEQELVNYYNTGSSDTEKYMEIADRWSAFQQSAELKSKGLLVHEFIQANRPFIPSEYLTLNEYVSNRKEHYFDYLEVSNTTLQASGYLIDKFANYVFTALPLEQMTAEKSQDYMLKNVETVSKKLNVVSDLYKFNVYNSLRTQAASNQLNLLADGLFENYMKNLATTAEDKQLISEIEVQNRIRIGAAAPNIVWSVAGTEKQLNTIEGAKNYLLVFWSSTCGHCLKELPALHQGLADFKNLEVIAVGLEYDDTNWLKESAKLPNFKHTIALGKWESDYSKLYGISKTPTYFLLDDAKKILAKPDSYVDVIEFLNVSK